MWFGEVRCQEALREVRVVTFRRAGTDPEIWRGRGARLSESNHVYKGGGNRRVDKLLQEQRNGTLI